ncbi:MAG: glycosyltransferase family 10 [Hymenobacter sp.]
MLQRVLPRVVANQIANAVAARRRRIVQAINRGPVPPLEKLAVIRSYRFVVCYENTSTPGYISEKLFDCLFAGCVPVYLGEPNIRRFIPEDCFVDRKAFATDAELADFLKQMTYTQYENYVEAMRRFTKGVERQKFGSEANAKRITEVLLADLAAASDNLG